MYGLLQTCIYAALSARKSFVWRRMTKKEQYCDKRNKLRLNKKVWCLAMRMAATQRA